MDLDGFLAFFFLLLHWRVVLTTAAGGLAGYALVKLAPWFSGLQGVFLAGVGLALGLIWQATLEDHRGGKTLPGSPGNTSPHTVVAAAGLFAAVWGAASSSSMHSAVAGAAVLLAVAYGWLKFAQARLPHLHGGHVWLGVLAAALAYPTAAALAHSAA